MGFVNGGNAWPSLSHNLLRSGISQSIHFLLTITIRCKKPFLLFQQLFTRERNKKFTTGAMLADSTGACTGICQG